MIKEIITKVGSIQTSNNFVFGDGNPALKRAGHNKCTPGYIKSGLWNVYISKTKMGKKEELTDIVLEHEKAKIEGVPQTVYTNKIQIISDAFLIANLSLHDDVQNILSNIGVKSNSKLSYSTKQYKEHYAKIIKVFSKALYEKEDLSYENGYLIIKNIPSGAYKVWYITDVESYVSFFRLQRSNINVAAAAYRAPHVYINGFNMDIGVDANEPDVPPADVPAPIPRNVPRPPAPVRAVPVVPAIENPRDIIRDIIWDDADIPF